MANIYTRGNTLWVHYSINGKQYRESTKLKNTKANKKVVLSRCAHLDDLIENNIQITVQDLIFEKYDRKEIMKTFIDLESEFNRFIESKNSKHKSMFKSAFKKFQESNEVISNLPLLKLNSINESHYLRFKKYLMDNLTYDSARTYISYMNVFINDCIKRDIYLHKNPFIRMKRHDKKEIRIIKKSHVQLILDYLEKNNLELFRFIYFLRYSGFRLREAIELRWEQINFDENIISMTNFKDNRNDLFPLGINNGLLRDLLLNFRNKSGKVFDLKYEWVRVPFQNAIRKINEMKKQENDDFQELPIYTIHDLRRTFVSELAQSNLSQFEVKNLARHKDSSTTERYYVSLDLKKSSEKFNSYLRLTA